jgi:hypothetical protein
VPLSAIHSQNNCRLLSNVGDFGTHPRLRHLGNGGVMMMSQGKKYLWIDIPQTAGAASFLRIII